MSDDILDIGAEFCHKCKCGNEIKYSSEKWYIRAKESNKLCGICSHNEIIDKYRKSLVFNKKGCELMDKLNRIGYNFTHALNGGEHFFSVSYKYGKGIFVDGYDSNKKIIMEYDEKHHELEPQKSIDIARYRVIFKFYHGIRIIRYSEVMCRFYEINRDGNDINPGLYIKF